MVPSKKFLLCILTTLMVVIQSINPITAHADGETTPAPEETSAITTTPAPTDLPEIASTPVPDEPTVAPVETSVSAPTDISAAPTETVVPAETDTPIPPTDATEAPTESLETTQSTSESMETVIAEGVTEAPSAAEILQVIPEGTDVVILDENGNPEPLATEDAAEIITTGDPMWCPDGIAPGGSGCTPPYRSTMNELLTLDGAYINSQNVNGTIWITSGIVGDVAPIAIYGTTYSNWANYSLTLQGGWGGTSNSVFTVPISISNWNGNITVNNITIQNTSDSGLSLSNDHNVTINNSTFSGNSYQGVSAFRTGDITINESTFDGNGTDGLEIVAGSPITVNILNSTFSYNSKSGNGGVYINDSNGTVYIGYSTFHDNNYGLYVHGLKMYSPEENVNVTLECNNFKNNGQDKIFGVVTLKDNPCSPSNPPESPVVEIPVTGNSFSYPIDCYLHSGYIFAWSNGDRVLVSCVSNGEVKIDHKENTNKLPGDLEKGYQYASGFEVQVLQNGTPLSVMPKGGFIRVSFVTDEREPIYDIMYWNEGAGGWDLLETFQKNRNGTSMEFPLGTQSDYKILKGTQLIPGSNREEVTTNFPGTFVLVQK